MVLPREKDQFRSSAKVLDGAEVFFRLAWGNTIVSFAMQKQDRCPYFSSVANGRVLPVIVERREQVAPKVATVAERAIARAFYADEIADAGNRNRSFEHARLRHDPIGHEAAIAVANHPEPVRVNP